MPLDPKPIREAQAAYRQCNEAELRENLQRQKAADLARYYEKILMLQAWKKRRGSAS